MLYRNFLNIKRGSCWVFATKSMVTLRKFLFQLFKIFIGNHVPDGLGVRIPGFHPGGPGSIPGLGVIFLKKWSNLIHILYSRFTKKLFSKILTHHYYYLIHILPIALRINMTTHIYTLSMSHTPQGYNNERKLDVNKRWKDNFKILNLLKNLD